MYNRNCNLSPKIIAFPSVYAQSGQYTLILTQRVVPKIYVHQRSCTLRSVDLFIRISFLTVFQVYRPCFPNVFALTCFTCKSVNHSIFIDNRVFGLTPTSQSYNAIYAIHSFFPHAQEWGGYYLTRGYFLYWYPFMSNTHSVTFDQLSILSVTGYAFNS